MQCNDIIIIKWYYKIINNNIINYINMNIINNW